MLGSFKFTHVIMALLMSVAMIFSMTGAATAAGCSNPTHQHAFTLTSKQTILSEASGDETIIAVDGVGNISTADNKTDNVSIYNSNGSHRVLADSGSGYLYKQSHSKSAHHSNRLVLVVAFKHRSPPDAWDDVKRQ